MTSCNTNDLLRQTATYRCNIKNFVDIELMPHKFPAYYSVITVFLLLFVCYCHGKSINEKSNVQAPSRAFNELGRKLLPARERRRWDSTSVEEDDNDIPRNALGFLCQDNPLVEELGTRCRTISKNIGGLGCDRKIVELAAEKGRNIDAIPSAFRQARVADACPESCGLCESK